MPHLDHPHLDRAIRSAEQAMHARAIALRSHGATRRRFRLLAAVLMRDARHALAVAVRYRPADHATAAAIVDAAHRTI